MNETPESYNIIDLQRAELEVLREFDRVCKKLKVRYLIFSGTLLGAVRHKGFIPWDDDIDMVMFRNDFEVFCKNAPSEIHERYFLQTLRTDSEFPNVHAKLRDSHTTLIEECNAHRNMNHGIYIDIFPLDGVPNDPIIRNIGWNLISVIGKLALLKLTCTGDFTLRMKIFKGVSHLIPLSGRSLSLIYSGLCKCVDINRAENVAFSTWPSDGLSHTVYPKDWFFDEVLLDFEGMRLPSPKMYDLILTQLYGNYMELPPEDKRVGHRTIKVSTKIPYTEYK